MKNSGFTLVELLAVIVILAVLALIATPVVLSIIDDAKESAMLRSAEMYLSGVENAVMRENMNSGGNFRPNECTISNGNMTCGNTNVEVEVDGEVPSTGSIVFENGKIKEVTLNYTSGTIIKDASGNLVYEGSETPVVEKLGGICTYDSTNGVAEKTAGAKYSCEVKPGTSYNFYVLTTPKEGDATIDLIMDRNICEDGTPATSTNICGVDYNSSGDAAGEGPKTAMTYLNNATSLWENVDNLNTTYNDEGGNFTGYVLNGKSRLPYISEIRINMTYLFDNLPGSAIIGKTPMDGIGGYWTFSSVRGYSNMVYIAAQNGPESFGSVSVDLIQDTVGVRPVINLKI